MSPGRLQDELKKKRPFEVPEQEVNVNILLTGDRIAHRLARLFRRYGLTTSQYNVLRILRGEGRALPSLDIAGRMVQAVPAITGLIDRLERQGLVTRRRCSRDRRVVYVDITDAAQRLLKRIDRPLIDLHRELTGHLTRQELKQLSRLLEKVRQSPDECRNVVRSGRNSQETPNQP